MNKKDNLPSFSDPILWTHIILYRHKTKSRLAVVLPHGMTGLQIEEFVDQYYPRDWEITHYS